MIDAWEIALRLALAALLGAVIGADRQRNEWAAGLRTHMLVSVGAAMAIIVSAFGFQDILGTPHVVLDPSRIAAQVVSGIGFLGAGTIMFMQREQIVRGLTTAAGLWVVASIGLAAGSGLYAGAVIGTALVWIILAIIKPIERRMFQRQLRPRVMLRLRAGDALTRVDAELRRLALPLYRLQLQSGEEGQDLTVIFQHGVGSERLAAFVDAVRGMEGVEAQGISPEPRG